MIKKILTGLVVAVFIASAVIVASQPSPGGEPFYAPKSQEVEADISVILPYFDEVVWDELQAIPIRSLRSVDTALAQTIEYCEDGREPAIYVSLDWDTNNNESVFWETYRERGEAGDEPVFPDSFKERLLIHEFLHFLEAERGIDLEQFYADVQEWYHDPTSGSPVYDGGDCNYIKYSLWHSLYSGGERYADSIPGVEEYAYIGVHLANGLLDRYEVSEAILDYYRGILNNEVLK